MRIGKAIDHSHDVGVVPPRTALSPKTKVKYAVLASVPVAMVIGAVLKGMNPKPNESASTRTPGTPAAAEDEGPREI
jgi:hypothetical protein